MQSYDYSHRAGVYKITWEGFYALTAQLAEELAPYQPDAIVGVARAGLFPATAVACMLRRELYPARLTRRLNDEVVYKKPVIFGPYMQNFSEIAQTLGESGAGILTQTKEDLLIQAKELLNNKQHAQMLGEKGFQVIQKHQGATDRNMEMINRFIQ